MGQNIFYPKRSIKPYTKDRTKMTITKEELTRPGKLIALDRSARHISHLVTCLIVVPNFPENESTRNGYLSELEKAVEAMKEECNV